VKPSKVEVELATVAPNVVGRKGYEKEESVTGEAPRIAKVVHAVPPAQVTVVVATVPSVVAEVQYARLPVVGALEVLIPLKVKAPVAEL
jgi:hypothetical protein